MSKKELLDRLSRSSAGSAGRRASRGESGASGSETRRRVAPGVVRRRRQEKEEESQASTSPTSPAAVRRAPRNEPSASPPRGRVVRRRSGDRSGPPGRKAEETVEAAPVEAVEPTPAPTPEVAPEPLKVEAAPEPMPEPAPEPVKVEAKPEPKVEEAPAPAPEVKAEPVVEAAPEKVEAAPAPVAEKPAAEAADEPAAAKEAPADKQAAAEAAPAKEPDAAADRERPDSPRFKGLGVAVVAPPPGYDPNDPNAHRRRAATAPPGRRAAPPGRTAGARNEGPRWGDNRRREAAGPGGAGAPAGAGAPGGSRGGSKRRGRGRSVADSQLYRRKPRRTGRGGRSGGGGTSTVPMKASKRKVRIDNVISVGQLAHEMGLKAPLVIKKLIEMGQMATVNEMLDFESASLVAAEFQYEAENVGFQEEEFLQHVPDDTADEEAGEPRAPVVTIMGHVDHGKTTLLDSIRSARVAVGEAGGITQHIGAYQVDLDGKAITFLDTPGHAAFTAMRARGAAVTDIVVLVVAVDDGVQPQTEEAIQHARAAGCPIVVAVNKMDKIGANPDAIKQRLTEYGLTPDDWGGDTMFVPVSALKGEGIDDLLEAILLQADVLELRANPDRAAEGSVVEAKLERGRGAVATVLVSKGTLNRGDNVVLGAAWGRVRAMVDSAGKRVKEAGPSMPVEIFGLSEVPAAGDSFVVVENEKAARKLAEHRAQLKRDEEMAKTRRRTAEDLFAMAQGEEKETLNIVLKADVAGSLEALKASIAQIEVDGAEPRLLLSGVGPISESDVTLASANGALLVGFNVKPDANARKKAQESGVNAEIFEVIYGVLDRIKALMKGLIGPVYEEVRQGTAEVRAVFNISRIGQIAGCYIMEGKVGRNHTAKVLRGPDLVWEGRVTSLKRFKDDVREVGTGYECGIGLDNFKGFEVGDVIETYALVEKTEE